LWYKDGMAVEIDATNGKKLIVGIGTDEQDERLASKEPIECFIEGWSDEDVKGAETWPYLTIKGRRYILLSPVRATGTLTIQLEE
jgi:hypothetical protein